MKEAVNQMNDLGEYIAENLDQALVRWQVAFEELTLEVSRGQILKVL